MKKFGKNEKMYHNLWKSIYMKKYSEILKSLLTITYLGSINKEISSQETDSALLKNFKILLEKISFQIKFQKVRIWKNDICAFGSLIQMDFLWYDYSLSSGAFALR